MLKKDKAMEIPANRKLGKEGETVLTPRTTGWAAPTMTFRAKRRVTDDTVVKINWDHQVNQDRRRSKTEACRTTGSILCVGVSPLPSTSDCSVVDFPHCFILVRECI